MKRKRTKLPPLLALYKLKEEVFDIIRETTNNRTQDISTESFSAIKIRLWKDVQHKIDKILKETTPIREIKGWKLGDIFKHNGVYYTIEKFPTLDMVYGVNDIPDMGDPMSCTIHVMHIKKITSEKTIKRIKRRGKRK